MNHNFRDVVIPSISNVISARVGDSDVVVNKLQISGLAAVLASRTVIAKQFNLDAKHTIYPVGIFRNVCEHRVTIDVT